MKVDAAFAGERLDKFLAEHLGSRSAAERAVEHGALVAHLLRTGIPPRKLGGQLRLAGVERHELAAAARHRIHHPVDVAVVHSHHAESEPSRRAGHRDRIRAMGDRRNGAGDTDG